MTWYQRLIGIVFTLVLLGGAAYCLHYGVEFRSDSKLREALLGFAGASFIGSVICGAFSIFYNGE